MYIFKVFPTFYLCAVVKFVHDPLQQVPATKSKVERTSCSQPGWSLPELSISSLFSLPGILCHCGGLNYPPLPPIKKSAFSLGYPHMYLPFHVHQLRNLHNICPLNWSFRPASRLFQEHIFPLLGHLFTFNNAYSQTHLVPSRHLRYVAKKSQPVISEQICDFWQIWNGYWIFGPLNVDISGVAER